jgi:hypothetical protein
MDSTSETPESFFEARVRSWQIPDREGEAWPAERELEAQLAELAEREMEALSGSWSAPSEPTGDTATEGFFETRVPGWEMPEPPAEWPTPEPPAEWAMPEPAAEWAMPEPAAEWAMPEPEAEWAMPDPAVKKAPGIREAALHPSVPETEPAPGDWEAPPQPAGDSSIESFFESRGHGWEMPDPGRSSRRGPDTSAPRPPMVAPGIPGYRLRPTAARARTPDRPETPGWGGEGSASPAGADRLASFTREADRDQRFRTAPPTEPSPTATPGPATGAIFTPVPVPPAAAPGRIEPRALERVAHPPSPWKPTPTPPEPPAAGPPGAGQRPVLPLLPGGAQAPVSTRPWSLDAAMQPLAAAARPSIRAASPVSAAGPPPSRPGRGRRSAPFPVVAVLLFALLALIVVLILLHVRH